MKAITISVMNFTCMPIISFFLFYFLSFLHLSVVLSYLGSLLLLTHTYDYLSDAQGILSFSIPRCSTAFLLLLVGVLSSNHRSTYVIDVLVPLYTSHVHTPIPQPSAGLYTVLSHTLSPPFESFVKSS